ncbi:Major Facilitator Superfamily protein [Micromonospora viridifaciens]|uniref:Major Facilitator Superfamily protein n=1 Tax=Micromonospora viridifaciens TaxID=1881 RepID=A0A1C4VVW5_MICVI|nr:MFS transporter [Micromonospora viridifaciens]SCE87849.1 Major Facilitator Superfamily protein [Micromonospora viridifaciens]
MTEQSRRSAILLAVLLTGQAMASMDTSIAAVAAPAIRADLAGPPAVQQLVLAGYTLTFAVLVVTGARLGARHGYGRVFLLGLAGFTLASLACGLAPGAVALVLARAVQGAAAAVLVPQVLSLIQASFAGAARARAIGAYTIVLALGVAAGQVAGGLLVTADLGGLSWRTAFLVNVPVGVVLWLVGRQVLAGPPAVPPRREALDGPGVVLLTAAMLTLVLPLVLGRDLRWPGWTLAVAVAASAVGLRLFLRYEARRARRGADPLLDVTVLRHPGVPAGLLACCVVMGCYAGLLFVLTLRLQDGLGFTALAAGLAFLPYASGFALCGLVVPRLPDRAGAVLPVAGPLVLAAAVAAVAWLSRDGWPWLPGSALLLAGGAAHASSFSPLVTRLTAIVPVASAAALSALVSTGTLLAAVLGVALIGGLHLARPDAPLAPAALTAVLLLSGARAARLATRPTPVPAVGQEVVAPTRVPNDSRSG